jgi:endonuclease YncB( thermonuclease family)
VCHGFELLECGFISRIGKEMQPFFVWHGLRSVTVAFLLILCAPVVAEELDGRIVGIADGDTLTLLATGSRQVRIRLAGIDAPESRQPYGTRAQQELSALAFGKQARVKIQDTDRYGRTVGTVFVEALNVNQEMVRRGAAWVYTQYNRDPALPGLETRAREDRVGLWALPEHERQPPWDWRHSGSTPARTPPQRSTPDASANAIFSCGSKRYCSQMSNCAEAQFYLRQCGVSRLDGDRDGIPCETLCR